MTALPAPAAWSRGRADEPSPRALLLGDDLGIFLPVARSLGRRGIEVHLVRSGDEAPGLSSRYVAAGHCLPGYHREPDAWVAGLAALIERLRVRLVVPCYDAALHQLDRHGDALGRDRLALPNAEALAAFTDKEATRALAASHGVPVARGLRLTADARAGTLAEALGLPMILKPRASYTLGAAETKTAALLVRDRAALEAALPRAAAEGWLAESFFEGQGVGVSILAWDGDILLAWQHRRLATVTATGASSARRAEPLDPRLLADVEALAGAVRLSGVAMFEFKQEGAKRILIEVNPRFWGSLPLALAGGADFPALLWDMLAGEEVRPGPVRRTGLAKRNLDGELDRLVRRFETARGLARIQATAALVSLAFTLLSPKRFDSWAADDPAPWRVARRLALGRLARGATRHFGA